MSLTVTSYCTSSLTAPYVVSSQFPEENINIGLKISCHEFIPNPF